MTRWFTGRSRGRKLKTIIAGGGAGGGYPGWLDSCDPLLQYKQQEQNIEGLQLLADGDMEEPQYGSELVDNGALDPEYGPEELDESGDGTADKDNWSALNNAALTNPSINLLRIARDGNNNPRATQSTLTIGKRYRATGEARSDGNATPRLASSAGVTIMFDGTTSTEWQSFDVEWIADGATPRFVSVTSTGTEYTEWRKLSVTEVNPEWTKGDGWSIGSGVASCDGTQVANSDLQQTVNPLESGKTYSVTYTISNYSAGSIKSRVGGANGTSRSSDGTFTDDAILSPGTLFALRADSTFLGDDDDVSVKENILLNTWTAGNSANLTKEAGQRTGGSGTQVLKIERNAVNDPEAFQTKLNIGTRYHFSGWAKSDGNAIPRVTDGTTVHATGEAIAGWQYVDIYFEADDTDLTLQSQTSTGTEYTEWDDLLLVELTAVDGGDIVYATNRAKTAPDTRNVVVEGTFPNNPGVWNLGAGWSIAGNTASCDGSQVASSKLKQVGILTAGKSFEITYTITNYSSGSIQARWHTLNGIARASNGTFTETKISNGTEFSLLADLNFIGDIIVVSAQQTGIQSSDDFPGAEELVDGDMEAVDTSAWALHNGAVLSKQTTNPHGGTRVLRIARDVVNNPGAIQATPYLTIGKRYKVTGYARSGGGSAVPSYQTGIGGTLWSGTTSTNWQPFEFEYVTAQTNMFLRSTTSTGNEYTEWDDISVTEVNPLNATNHGAFIDIPTDLPLEDSYRYNEVTSWIEIPHVPELNSIINVNKGTLQVPFRFDSWGTTMYVTQLYADADNQINIFQTADDLFVRYKAGGVENLIELVTAGYYTGWQLPLLTWDTDANGGLGEVKGYINGELVETQTNLGVWAANLTIATIASRTLVPSDVLGGGTTLWLLDDKVWSPGKVLESWRQSGVGRPPPEPSYRDFSEGFSSGFS